MNAVTALYEEDLVRWSEEQAAALRSAAAFRTNLPLDWENLAEEIDTVGRSQRHEIRKRTRTLIRHLLKLTFSQASEPQRGWVSTIRRSRQEIADLIKDSPSLRPEREAILRDVLASESELTAEELDDVGESVAAAAIRSARPEFEIEQVFGDWLPGKAPPTA